MESITGSKAFTEVARSVLYCIADPDAEDGEGYLFTHEKNNLGPKQPSVRYRILEVKIELDPATVEPGDDTVVRTSRIAWGDQDERSARDVLEAGKEPAPMGDITEGILSFFRDQDGAVELEGIVAAFPDVDSATLRVTLGRMVKRSQLIRAGRGVYGLAPDPKKGAERSR